MMGNFFPGFPILKIICTLMIFFKSHITFNLNPSELINFMYVFLTTQKAKYHTEAFLFISAMRGETGK